MDTIAYTADDNKLHEPTLDKKKNTLSSLKNINKRWLFWGGLGMLFILAYTGGSYYVLFAMNKNTDTTAYTPRVPTSTPYPTPTAVPTVTPAVVSTANWITYINKKYAVSVQFPKELSILFNKTEDGVDPYLITISSPSSSTSGVLTINVQDIAYIGQSDVESRTIVNMPLLNFATKKRELNFTYDDPDVPNRGVSALTTTTFLEKPAYSFTVSGSYSDDRDYDLLTEEYTYLFTQNGNYKIVVSYPTGNSLLKKVFETIRFQ